MPPEQEVETEVETEDKTVDLDKKFSEFTKQMEGMIKRVTHETVESHLEREQKKAEEQSKAAEDKEKKTLRNQLKEMEAKLTAETTIRRNAEKQNAVSKAISGINWFDPDDAMDHFMSRVTTTEDGEFVVGETPLGEAVKDFAERKSHLVKADAPSGTGAGGNQSKFSQRASWPKTKREALSNPNDFHEMSQQEGFMEHYESLPDR